MNENRTCGCPCEGAAVRLDNNITEHSASETHVYFDPCETYKCVTVEDDYVLEEGLGRVLDVAVTIGSVCPGKRTALGISLMELDNGGRAHACGFRSLTVPAHHESGCRDIAVPVVRFVLPEDMRPDEGHFCCGHRHFVIRTTKHYIDQPDESRTPTTPRCRCCHCCRCCDCGNCGEAPLCMG